MLAVALREMSPNDGLLKDGQAMDLAVFFFFCKTLSV